MHRRAALRRLLFAVTLLALGPNCAGRPETRATGLLDTLRRHHEHLRWENYGAAATSVDSEFRNRWSKTTRQLGRVSDYELGAINMKDPPGDDASVLVKVSGFRIPDLTVRTVLFQERWRRVGDKWHLTEFAPAAPELPDVDL